MEGTWGESHRRRKRSVAIVTDRNEDDCGIASAGRHRGIKATKRKDERRKREERVEYRLDDISGGLKPSSAAIEPIDDRKERGNDQQGDYMLM